MNKIYLGKYVNTHGIKGEIRIKSDFKYKNKAFLVGNTIYINEKSFVITSYRVHKGYDMVILDGIRDINDIEYLKGSLVFIDKDNINLNSDEYLDEDLLDCKVYVNNNLKGVVTGYEYLNKNKKILVIDKVKMIPFELIKNIDLKKKRIDIEGVDGLL
ncbi:MAG: 16S rRNA processing protein RimM [Bacilli bacterium]|nr:16S rRNA processing protein RimM [Bacilli bacterium]